MYHGQIMIQLFNEVFHSSNCVRLRLWVCSLWVKQRGYSVVSTRVKRVNLKLECEEEISGWVKVNYLHPRRRTIPRNCSCHLLFSNKTEVFCVFFVSRLFLASFLKALIEFLDPPSPYLVHNPRAIHVLHRISNTCWYTHCQDYLLTTRPWAVIIGCFWWLWGRFLGHGSKAHVWRFRYCPLSHPKVPGLVWLALSRWPGQRFQSAAAVCPYSLGCL